MTMTATVNTTGGDDDGNGGSGSDGHTHVLVYFVLSLLNIILNLLMHLCDLVTWPQITK